MMGQVGCRSLSAAVLIALLWLGGGPLLAQGAGEVEGQVKGAQGEPLSGVTVELLKAGNGDSRKLTSDAQGAFRFDRLASGVYIVTASMEGYASVTCPGVRIVSSLTRRLQIQLRPGGGEPPAEGAPPAEETPPAEGAPPEGSPPAEGAAPSTCEVVANGK